MQVSSKYRDEKLDVAIFRMEKNIDIMENIDN